MRKIDLVKERADLYRPPSKEPVLVDVPEMAFVMIDGSGDPNTAPAYARAVEALYAVSYAVRFALKRGSDDVDVRVMPLEGLWWSDRMADFVEGRREGWRWTMMIAQPDPITPSLVEAASADAARKKDLPALADLSFERFGEGTCAQVMHVGPYAAERPTIEKLHAFIAEHGHLLRGKHHEIYLRDPRRTAPERLKTIIRQPVERR